MIEIFSACHLWNVGSVQYLMKENHENPSFSRQWDA